MRSPFCALALYKNHSKVISGFKALRQARAPMMELEPATGPSAGTLLSWVRAPQPMPRPDGGPVSLGSTFCGLAIYKNQTKPQQDDLRLYGSSSGQGANDGA
ncbi:hypothetical protein PoB_003733300 [Plakobranchus ocellatus]|uniref:Uncharacterized protein n=1 Tax=Plakobranchus ocellatus TaxID=259542 RepID=A0AAV4AWD5_9GAST|nr:hypothetical protein PoB_003733300 [Plakobranchus ocellatus]